MALRKAVYTEIQQAVITVCHIPVWLYSQKGVKLYVYNFLSKSQGRLREKHYLS